MYYWQICRIEENPSRVWVKNILQVSNFGYGCSCLRSEDIKVPNETKEEELLYNDKWNEEIGWCIKSYSSNQYNKFETPRWSGFISRDFRGKVFFFCDDVARRGKAKRLVLLWPRTCVKEK